MNNVFYTLLSHCLQWDLLQAVISPSLLKDMYMGVGTHSFISGPLPDFISAAVASAFVSGRKLSWKVQESTKRMLIQLVWKPEQLCNAEGKFTKPHPCIVFTFIV